MDITISGDFKKFRREILKRIHAAQKIAGRAVAEGTKDEVLKNAKLRSAGGQYAANTDWIKLYRNALTFLESKDGRRWAVAGMAPTKLKTVPAEATQIKFANGGGPVIDAVRPYIWTVDTLPAISGGWPGNVIVRHASAQEVMKHRETVRPELPRLIEQLKSAGAQVIDDFPVVNGKVLMDLKFLQLRLEHGLGGFPRSPHWKPAVQQIARKAEKLVKAKTSEIEDAIKTGKVADPEHTMSPGLEKLLKQVRDTSWV